MKRILCIILSCMLAFSVLGTCLYTLSDYRRQDTAHDFCNEVIRLNSSHPIIEESSTPDTAEAAVKAEEKITPESFTPKQEVLSLIVKVDENVSSRAIDCAIGSPYSVFTYKTREDMLSDRAELEAKGLMTQQDGISHICAESTDVLDSYKSMGADKAKTLAEIFYPSRKSLTIGVIDTGIFTAHSIFDSKSMSTGINMSASGSSDSILDDNGHGTAVASIIARSTPDNVGIRGYKLLDKNGSCYDSSIIAMLNYIVNEVDRPEIINMSFGGYNVSGDNSVLHDVLDRLVGLNVTICVAAGNDNSPAELGNISSYQNAIVCSSCDKKGKYSYFSNYGEDYIDIAAVGERVYAAAYNPNEPSATAYDSLSGTSFSAPFAAAACAYIIMNDLSKTPAQVEAELKQGAIPVDDAQYYGAGVLNFLNLVQTRAFVENASLSLEPNTYDSSLVEVSFDVPEGYTLCYSTDSMATLTDYTYPFTLRENTNLCYALKHSGRYASRVDMEQIQIDYVAGPADVTIQGSSIIGWEGRRKNVNVIIPDVISNTAITSIGTGAFQGLVADDVTLGDGINTIMSGAFASSTLRSITAHGVKTLKSKNNFYGCLYLREADMPALEKMAPYSFYYCKCLHSINFGDTLTNLPGYAFAYSGIDEISLPDFCTSSYVSTYTFEHSTLRSCDMPNALRIGSGMFSNASFLSELNIPAAERIDNEAFFAATELNEVNLTSVTRLCPSALTGCYIEHVYLPGVTCAYTSGGTQTNELGMIFVMSKSVDMPNLESLGAGSFSYSGIEELYLGNATSIDQNAICNAPYLKVMCCNNATTLNLPAVVEEEGASEYMQSFCRYPTTDIIYAPKAYVTGKIGDCRVLFTGGRENVYVQYAAIKMVLITRNTAAGHQTVIRKGTSSLYPRYTINQYDDNNKSTGYYYNNVSYTGGQGDSAVYDFGVSTFKIPFRVLERMYEARDLNLEIDCIRLRLLDVNEDGIINAKDFAIIHRACKNA